MKVLVVGGGGREHALAWALSRSPRITTLRCAPGNPGIDRLAEPVAVGAGEVDALESHAVSERYDLVVVGPEAPLVAGLGDRLRSAGIPVFGPSAGAAEIESELRDAGFTLVRVMPTTEPASIIEAVPRR